MVSHAFGGKPTVLYESRAAYMFPKSNKIHPSLIATPRGAGDYNRLWSPPHQCFTEDRLQTHDLSWLICMQTGNDRHGGDDY